jgi:ribulose-phosphate 3-epimerase
MIKLAPSILSADFSRLGEEIQNIERAGADLIHIDVMDGHFVPNITLGPMILKDLEGKTKLPFDIHLMIENPERFIESFVTVNTQIITVHAEACTHLHRVIQQIRSYGIKAGVSFNPATPLDALEYIMADIDLILIMSVNPGFGGQKFIPSSMEKIRRAKELVLQKNPKIELEIDGGITLENVKAVKDAGVDIVVAGSAIFGAPDTFLATREFILQMR